MKTRIMWFIHNAIGHPMMGVCQLLGLKELGDYFHEVTLPKGGSH